MTATAPSALTPSTFVGLVGRGAAARELEDFLAQLAPAARIEAVRSVTGKGVKRLYETADHARALSIDELLPAETSGPLIYEGRNSLAVFSKFQKRFYRTETGLVMGYNHQSMSWATGPGYYVLKAPSGEGPHPTELLFDYTVAPPAPPPGWPPYSSNERGLARLVYGFMHDYVRRLAPGVFVGKAYKKGVDQDAFFTLTREA